MWNYRVVIVNLARLHASFIRSMFSTENLPIGSEEDIRLHSRPAHTGSPTQITHKVSVSPIGDEISSRRPSMVLHHATFRLQQLTSHAYYVTSRMLNCLLNGGGGGQEEDRG